MSKYQPVPSIALPAARPASAKLLRRDSTPPPLSLLPPTMRRLLRPASIALAKLTSGARDLSDRHQTLRATIARRYQLLAEQKQKLYDDRAVAAGGCMLEATQAVGRPDAQRSRALEHLVALALQATSQWYRQQYQPPQATSHAA